MLFLRSLVFNLFFYLWTALLCILLIPTLILPGETAILAVARLWARGSLVMLRIICGTRMEFRGLEKIPPGGCIIATKHQSALETFSQLLIASRPSYIFKYELMYAPLFGLLMYKAHQIPVKRGKKGVALLSMTDGARKAIAGHRQILIFPEGTRRAVDAPPDYKFGVTHLYTQLGVPCVPVALNTGVFWRRRSLTRLPGTAVIEILDPIPPGLSADAFAARLEAEIEAGTARLVAEARAAGAAG